MRSPMRSSTPRAWLDRLAPLVRCYGSADPDFLTPVVTLNDSLQSMIGQIA